MNINASRLMLSMTVSRSDITLCGMNKLRCMLQMDTQELPYSMTMDITKHNYLVMDG